MLKVNILSISWFRVDVVNARIAAENKASAKLNAKSAQSSTPPRSKHPSGKPSERGRRGSGTPGSTPIGSKTTTSHLAKLTPKQINIKERKATDFFGRVIEVFNSVFIKKYRKKYVL